MTSIDPMTAITMVVIGGGIMVMGAVRIIVDWQGDRKRRRDYFSRLVNDRAHCVSEHDGAARPWEEDVEQAHAAIAVRRELLAWTEAMARKAEAEKPVTRPVDIHDRACTCGDSRHVHRVGGISWEKPTWPSDDA